MAMKELRNTILFYLGTPNNTENWKVGHNENQT